MALRNLSIVAASAAVLGLSTFASAAIIVNGNFSTQDTGPTDALGWTGENGTTIARLPTGGTGGTPGLLISTAAVTGSVSASQNTFNAGGDPAVGGTQYTLSFDNSRVFAAGGVFFVQLIAQDQFGAATGFPVQQTLTTPTAGASTFENFSATFTAPANTTRFTLNFFANTGGAAGTSSAVIVDNVAITGPGVPEPTSLGLLGLGGLALLRRKR